MKTSVIIGFLCSLLVGVASAQESSHAASIIQQSGENLWRENFSAQWASTELQQTLDEGHHVKTGPNAKMALLFRDESQLRLNQNSLLIIQNVLDEQGQSTRFRLNTGRAWVKSKNIPDKLIMETPSAVAAIRGTDWDIVVDEAGNTTLTVLHGQILLSNALGQVTVNANEQAIANVGQAPYKLIITNPQTRIQWVSEYQLNPLNYLSLAHSPKEKMQLDRLQNLPLSDYSTYLTQFSNSDLLTALIADYEIYLGNITKAIDLITQRLNSRDIPELVVLRAKAQLVIGEAYTIPNPRHLASITLHNANVAYFNGLTEQAITLYNEVLEIQPDNIDALYGLGRIYTELEHADLAFELLDDAIKRAPTDPRPYAEKATLHSFLDEFKPAQTALDQAEQNGSNKVIVLVGRAVLALKQGQLEKAKQFFLQAGVIEPQFSRIQLFLGITYYQLGQRELAIKTLEYASELDHNDPLPYFLISHIQRETYHPSQALNASFEGIERLPYLKSVNQLANNLSGSTNLGAALASYGLNEWALKLAVDSYHPLWASSQLFLSHRVNNDRFVQQSELFKGILNDPLVFGGSNTFTDIVEQPGIHGTVRFQRVETKTNGITSTTHSPSITLNGINKNVVPVAFFAEQIGNNSQTKADVEPLLSRTDSSPEFTRLGLGIEITPKLSAFYYSNSGGGLSTNQSLVQTNNTNAPNQVSTLNDLNDRYFGVQYQLSPTSDINLTYFDIDDFNRQSSQITTNTEIVQDDFSFISNSDVTNLFTQNRGISTTQVSWRVLTPHQHFVDIGFSKDKNNSVFELNTVSDIRSVTRFQGEILNEINLQTNTSNTTFDVKDIKQSYLHLQTNRFKQWYADLLVNYFDISANLTTNGDLLEENTNLERLNDSNVSFGVGIKYRFNDQWLIRQSYRDWTNSGSAVTSGPTLLAGIPFNTQFSLTGTEIQRTALQLEYQTQRAYVQFSADFQQIDNRRFSNSFVNNTTDLLSNNIRQLSAVNNDISTLFESDSRFFADPRFDIERGKAEIYAVSASTYLSERWSGNVSFRYFETEQQNADENGQTSNDRFFTNQARSILRFTTNYTAPFSANIFINGSYYHYPSIEDDLDDGWIWNLGWRQELFHKRVLISVQRLIQNVDRSNSWNINTEIRF